MQMTKFNYLVLPSTEVPTKSKKCLVGNCIYFNVIYVVKVLVVEGETIVMLYVDDTLMIVESGKS